MANEGADPEAADPWKPLDHSATKELQNVLSGLRAFLLTEATKSSAGPYLTADDLHVAYKRLEFPDRSLFSLADAQSVISQALRENRFIEWVSYGMAVALFLFGLFLFSVGVWHQDAGTRIGAFSGGLVVEALILIPFRFAIQSRRHNIALRMLGIVLNRVNDPKQLAPILKDTFLAITLGRQGKR